MAEENSSKFLEPLNPADRVQVKDFFKGKNVFITGATGFMGKALVEKLLWSCEDIGNLYLLIRPKKGETAQQRVEDMRKSPTEINCITQSYEYAATMSRTNFLEGLVKLLCEQDTKERMNILRTLVFDRIRQRDECILSKICAIGGDVSEIVLGISTEDRRILEDTVSVVFHLASSVRFDDPLKKAVLINVRGTREVVDLAKGMKNLKVFAYVSTTYANSDKHVIEEKFYKSTGVDWRTLLKCAETQDENILNIITPKIIEGLPNTYTFTKKLAESIVYEARHELPLLIFRPSIVVSSLKEPLPGWMENLNGPLGISTGYLTGVVHCMLVDGDKVTDYIPCDYVTNALIASAWYRGLLNSSDCVVIHSAAGDKSRVTSNCLLKTRDVAMDKMPFERVIWYPSTIFTTNVFVYTILFYFTHLLPAVAYDVLLRMKGEKFRMMRLYQKIFLGNRALAFFTTHEWKIETGNSDILRDLMHPKDIDMFPFDMRGFNLTDNVVLNVGGIKKYILNEDTSEAALAVNRKRNKMFQNLHYILKGAFYLLIGWILREFIIIPTFTYINIHTMK